MFRFKWKWLNDVEKMIIYGLMMNNCRYILTPVIPVAYDTRRSVVKMAFPNDIFKYAIDFFTSGCSIRNPYLIINQYQTAWNNKTIELRVPQRWNWKYENLVRKYSDRYRIIDSICVFLKLEFFLFKIVRNRSTVDGRTQSQTNILLSRKIIVLFSTLCQFVRNFRSKEKNG